MSQEKYNKHTDENIATLQPDFAERVRKWLTKCRDNGLNPLIHYGSRSVAEQQALHAKFVANLGPRAVAPERSYHCYGRAFDWVHITNADGGDAGLAWDDEGAYAKGTEIAKPLNISGIGSGDNDHLQDGKFPSFTDLPKSEFGKFPSGDGGIAATNMASDNNAPAVDVSMLYSSLLHGNPVLEAIAAGHMVLHATGHEVGGIGPVQDALKQLGFPIDLGSENQFRGFFGEKTSKALEAFANNLGLSGQGEVRQETVLALDKALLASALVPKPASNNGLPKRLPDYASQKLSAANGVPWDKAEALAEYNGYSGLLTDSFCKFVRLANMPSPGVTTAVIYECKFAIDSDGVAQAGDINHQGQTSLRNASGVSLDASLDPFTVIPLSSAEAAREGLHKHPGLPDFSDLGIKLGDVGIAFWKDLETVFVIGDEGPPNNIGEGSIKMAQNLGIPSNPSNGGFNVADVKNMKKGVIHIVFPGSSDLFLDGQGRHCTRRNRVDIESLAKQLYAAFRSQVV